VEIKQYIVVSNLTRRAVSINYSSSFFKVLNQTTNCHCRYCYYCHCCCPYCYYCCYQNWNCSLSYSSSCQPPLIYYQHCSSTRPSPRTVSSVSATDAFSTTCASIFSVLYTHRTSAHTLDTSGTEYLAEELQVCA
jgi:hypothetical protein